MGVLVNKIETEMADIKAAAKASGDPYAYDEDPKYDELLLAHNAADSLQRLLHQEVKGHSDSRVKSLIEELTGIEDILR